MIIVNEKDKAKLDGRYIFLDSDFLSNMFHEEEFLDEALLLFSKSYPTIDPFIEFEFLRDVFLTKQRKLKENFLAKEDIFFPAVNQADISRQIHENAMILSMIYTHQAQKSSVKMNVSLVDLFLAARTMFYPSKSVLVTGNKKDYPSCIFDTLLILNWEQKDGTIRAFCCLTFSKEKFEKCFKELHKTQEKSTYGRKN